MIWILLAAYNGERYIRQQIDSILEQSFKDFKLVIADDGSTDKTFSIISEYQHRYPGKIMAVQNKFPTGSAKGNFFYMLETYARDPRAEYVIFADQDDVWLPKKLAVLMNRMQRLEERYTKETPLLAYANASVTDEQLNILHPDMEEFLHLDKVRARFSHLLTENCATGNSMLMNRALILAYQRPEDALMHDWWIALIAASIGKMSFIREPLTLYRQHGENTLGARDANAWSELLKRITEHKARKEQIRENYRLIFAQARSLYDIYADRMDARKCMQLKAFIRLQSQSRIGKIFSICRHRFFKSTKLMSLGQMFTV